MKRQRTRSHIIADLSVNHVERFVLHCGHTLERVVHDYGIDLILHTYDTNGEPENEAVYIQMKATDNLFVRRQQQQDIAVTIERAHLERWLEEIMPVILIVYDARQDCAYWLYTQAYFRQLPHFNLATAGETVSLHIKRSHVVNAEAIQQFAQFKQKVLDQIRGVIHHDE